LRAQGITDLRKHHVGARKRAIKKAKGHILNGQGRAQAATLCVCCTFRVNLYAGFVIPVQRPAESTVRPETWWKRNHIWMCA